MSLLLVSSSFFPSSIVASNAAQNSAPSGLMLKHFVLFNTYGQYSVNDSLIQNSSSTSSLSSVVFGFPQNLSGHVVALSAYVISGTNRYAASVSQSTQNNSLLLDVSFQPSLPAGTNGSVNLGFYVIGTFKPINSSNYKVPMVFSPSINVKADSLYSSIVLPYLTAHVADGTPMRDAGFSQTVNDTAETWTLSTTNTTGLSRPRFNTTNVYSNPASSGSVNFNLINRQILVGSSGSILVQDTITLKNLGENTITSIGYTPLTNTSTVTLIPSSQTLLSNEGTTNLTGGQLNLGAINAQVEPNAAETIILQYPLSNQYWSYSGGVYNVNIPTTAPVNAIIQRYQVAAKITSGIILTEGSTPPSLVLSNSTGGTGQLSFGYRTGIGSAFGSALPIASVLFLAVLITALVFRPKQKVIEEASSLFDELIRLLEDKVSGTNDLLGELKAKGSGMSRDDLVTTRSRIDELRSKTSSRFGVLRSQLGTLTVAVQSELNQVLTRDREYDRAVRDSLNSYDQFVSKKMKEDTLQRVEQGFERRMQQIANSMLDAAHDAREEYEGEA